MHMTMLVVIIEMRAVIVMESAAAGMITRKRENIAINTAMKIAVAGIPMRKNTNTAMKIAVAVIPMRKRANIATNTAMRAAVAVIPTRKRVDTPINTPINTAMKAAAAGIPMTTCIMIRSIPAKYDICPKGWKREHIS